MAKFLDTNGVSYHLGLLIKNAGEKLYLISPFLKINKQIKLLLEDKNRMKIDIRVVYGKNELQPEENNWLKGLDFVRSSFCENLHAKCYLSEKEAIVTSMNLYEFSQQNNNEMGILIGHDDDPQLYKDILDEAQRLIRFSEELKVTVEKVQTSPAPAGNAPKTTTASKAKTTIAAAAGHCIRCGTEIPLRLDAPYCRDCWSDWSKIDKKDEKHPEKYCHVCGSTAKTAFEKPRCYSCYKDSL